MTSKASDAGEDDSHSHVIEDHIGFQNGDFTLISSDNVRYKVPSQQLFAAR